MTEQEKRELELLRRIEALTIENKHLLEDLDIALSTLTWYATITHENMLLQDSGMYAAETIAHINR